MTDPDRTLRDAGSRLRAAAPTPDETAAAWARLGEADLEPVTDPPRRSSSSAVPSRSPSPRRRPRS